MNNGTNEHQERRTQEGKTQESQDNEKLDVLTKKGKYIQLITNI